MIEVEDDILSEVIKCEGLHEFVPEYGHRAWIARGKTVDVVYWDVGNGWCSIMDVIPRDGKGQGEVMRFYRRLRGAIARRYDEDGLRID